MGRLTIGLPLIMADLAVYLLQMATPKLISGDFLGFL